MSNLKVGQRIPLRPKAERSPSPDFGAKSIIASTTPPKVSKEQTLVKRDREESIYKIREENKKLREQMKYLLNKNNNTVIEDKSPFKNDQAIKGEIKTISPIKSSGGKDRPTEKIVRKESVHVSTSSVNQISPFNRQPEIPKQKIKELMYSIIQDKENDLNKKVQQLESRLRESEQTQRILEQKVTEYNSRLKTSMKYNYNTTPVHNTSHDRSEIGAYRSPDRYYTPSKNEQEARSIIHQLQFQLSGAQSTIRRLETILETEEKSLSSIKFETERKDMTILELKRQKQTLAKELRSASKLSSEQISKSEYESSIKKHSKVVEELERKLMLKEEELKNLKEHTAKQISFIKSQIKQDVSRKASIKTNGSEEQKRQKEQERKRQAIQYLEDVENRLEEASEVIKILQKQLELAKKGKSNNETSLKNQQQTSVELTKRIEQLTEENARLKESITKIKEQLEDINSVNRKFNEQRAEIESLTTQLTETLKTLETTKEQHKSESSVILGEVKNIKYLAQSVHIPDQKELQHEQNNDHQSAILKHKQQILQLEKTVHFLESQKQTIGSECRQLSIQNNHLKEKIKNLQQSIENFVKPVPREIIQTEEIETIILKQEIGVNPKVAFASKTISGATSKLTKLYEEINREESNHNN